MKRGPRDNRSSPPYATSAVSAGTTIITAANACSTEIPSPVPSVAASECGPSG
jgi:hypothetical protein